MTFHRHHISSIALVGIPGQTKSCLYSVSGRFIFFDCGKGKYIFTNVITKWILLFINCVRFASSLRKMCEIFQKIASITIEFV